MKYLRGMHVLDSFYYVTMNQCREKTSVLRSESILSYSMRTASDLLLPLEALRRERFFSRPRPLSDPSLVAPDFSLPRCLLFSSSFLLVGEGALQDRRKTRQNKNRYMHGHVYLLREFEKEFLTHANTNQKQRYQTTIYHLTLNR